MKVGKEMNERYEQWDEIWAQIKEAEYIAIYRHINPDPDAYGSQYGLADMILSQYPTKKVSCLGVLEKRLSFVYENVPTTEIVSNVPELIICVDTANTARIDGEIEFGKVPILKIDHHPNLEPYGTDNYVFTDSPATSAILLDFFLYIEKTLKLVIPESVLERLYVGIVGDTGNFSYGVGLNTAFFANIGILFERIDTKKMLQKFYEKTIEEVRFKGFLSSQVQKGKYGFTFVEFSSDDAATYQVSLDFATGLVNLLSEVEGTKVWATFCEDKQEGVIRCSLRSRYLKVSDIAVQFGGGGHPNAAGVRVASWEIVSEVKKAIEELLKNNEE